MTDEQHFENGLAMLKSMVGQTEAEQIRQGWRELSPDLERFILGFVATDLDKVHSGFEDPQPVYDCCVDFAGKNERTRTECSDGAREWSDKRGNSRGHTAHSSVCWIPRTMGRNEDRVTRAPRGRRRRNPRGHRGIALPRRARPGL